MKLDKMGILDFIRGALSMSTVYLLLGMTVLFLVYDLWTHTYFWRMGIPGPRPFPVIGNLADYNDIPGALERYSKEYGPVVGFYFWRDPILVINDLDILRKLLIKDFGKFTNRRKLPLSSGVMDHMLFNLHGAQWKRVREILTPTFTGRKLKIMSDALNDCADVMVDSLRDVCKRDGIIQCKDLYGGFVMDSVARCAFGLDVNSQKDPTHPFVTNARRIFDPSSSTPYFLAVSLIPNLKPFFKLIGITFMPKDVIQFFTAVVKEAIALRKRPGAKQSADFLQLLIEAEDGTGELANENDDDDMHNMHMNSSMERPSRAKGVSKKNLSEEEIIAQAMNFLTAGYETTATSLTLGSYLLATYPDVQEKLVAEIEEMAPERDDVNYTTISKMPYLDQVVCEILRYYPPLSFNDRECADVFTHGSYIIEPGVQVWIPIYSIHHNPTHWPEPHKFDPERFSKENRETRHPLAWMPFGAGPRMCIGTRLGLAEVKLALVRALQEVRFELSPQTQVPPELGKVGFLTPPNGVLLKVVSRCE